MLKDKGRSSDQIEKIRDHLKKMISCPLHKTEFNLNQSYITNTISSKNDIRSLPRDGFISKNKPTKMSKFQITLPSNKKDEFHPQCNNKIHRSGRSRKYDRFTLYKYLLQRKQNNLLHLKPELSFGQLICLAILQSDERKLILSEICRWISSNFPFYRLKDTNWQNSIRHTLSVNPHFIKLESVKVSNNNTKNNGNSRNVKHNKHKKRYVFVGKDNNGLNKVNQNIRKSSKWGVAPDGISSFFICSPEDLHLFLDMVKQINHLLVDGIYMENSYSTDSLSFQDPQLVGSFPLDFSSPLSQTSNSSIPLSNSSSMTDLTTLSFDSTSELGLPFALTTSADSPPIQKVEEQEPQHKQKIIYGIDSKLDLLETSKFDTTPTRHYILTAIENTSNTIATTDNTTTHNNNNNFVPFFFTDLNPPSPTIILNESTLYPYENTFFSNF